MSHAIEQIDAASIDYWGFLERHVSQSRPVIVRSAVSRWPALQKWTPEFFAAHYADHPVQVSYESRMAFGRFIEGVLASSEEAPGPYMYRLFLHEDLRELLPDLVPQNVFAYPRRLASPLMPGQWRRPDGYLKLLIGGCGGRFPVLHYDAENMHATITEIYGDKEFILYPPQDTPHLYPKHSQVNHSLVDDHDDFTRFPALRLATRFQGTISPGDMIFVPARWWHSARALNPSVSVGMNILDRSNWAGFVREVTKRDVVGWRRATLLRTYLTIAGSVFSAMEAFQRKSPAISRSLRIPALLAPASSAAAPEPAYVNLGL